MLVSWISVPLGNRQAKLKEALHAVQLRFIARNAVRVAIRVAGMPASGPLQRVLLATA